MPLNFNASVYTPMYECNNKQYIRFLVSDSIKQRVDYFHTRKILTTAHVDNPLEGNVLTVKVPYRYRRVMCKYEGSPVQSLKKGDDVEVDMDFMGCWYVGEYSGYSWKLSYIKLIRASTV